MNKFNRFAALRWVYNIIVPPRYRDKLNITEELCAFESTLNKVIEVTNANGRALEAISKDLEDIQFGAGGYYRPAITENEDGSVTFSFTASNDSMPPIEEKTFFLGDMQTITEMLEGFTGEPVAVKNYIDEMSGGYYTPVFEQNGSTVQVSFLASNKMLPALDGYSFTLPSGSTGKSAYDSYLDNGGTLTEKDWVNSLKGEDGESFYQMCVKNGFKGSETDLIIAMKGDPYELTESDITTIVRRVVENLGGQPVAGYFDENNDIVLTSTLPDGEYTIKYEMGDKTYTLGTVTVKTTVNKYTVTFVADGMTVAEVEYEEGATSLTGVPEVPAKSGYTGVWESYALNNTSITVNAVYTAIEPTYENLADPTSADWKEGYRLSISSGSVSALAGHTTTNFIKCAMGNTLRIKGMKITGSVGGTADGADYAKIVMYNSAKTKLGGLYGHGFEAEQIYTAKVTTDGDWSVYTILLDNNGKQWATDELRYIRIDGKLTGAASDVVINIITG